MTPEQLSDLLAPWLEAGPAYRGLATGLRGLILDGRLPVSSQVPSERSLARSLGLGRNTVTAAYDLLRAEGYLSSSHGAGSHAQLPSAGPVRPDRESVDESAVWDLTVAALPAPPALLDAMTSAMDTFGRHLSGHGLHPLGLPELREAVARHLSRRGLVTRPDQVLITNGALQGWNLVLQAGTGPGDRVLVEQPTYPGVIDAVVAQRRRAVAIPVSQSGWDIPRISTKLAHVTPDAQNPTGVVADSRQRRDLLRDLRTDVVVSDETFAELVLDPVDTTPLATLDRRVVTLGSMSKAYWAGLRIGWIRATPETVNRLAQSRAAGDLASPVLEQLIAAWLLDHSESILAPRLDHLRRSRDALTRTLADHLPNWRFTVPAGGLVLWIEVPPPGATVLAAHALDLGLRLSSGPRFTVDGTADRWFRLPFNLDSNEVNTLVRILTLAMDRSAAKLPSRRRPSVWTA